MKTHNTFRSTWIRRVSQLMAMLMITVSFAGQASALILFQDDDFHDIESEGLIINADDGGVEDVTLQFGNDGTDASIIFNDTTGDLSINTPGGDVSFGSNNITTTGDISATNITGSGVADFSGSTEFHIREVAGNPNTVAACTTLDELVLDTTGNQIYVCTATGIAGVATWVNTTPTSQDFESVYATDGDNTLTTSNGAFTINTGTAAFSVTGTTNLNVSNNVATNINTGTSTGSVSIGGGSGTVAINSSSWDISTAGVASGFTGLTSTGTINFSGASAFRIRENTDPATNSACAAIGELILDTTDNEIQICTATGIAGAATWVAASAGDADTLDGLDSLQFLRSDTSDNYTSGTLTFDIGTTLITNGTLTVNGVATIGDGGDSITINSSTWDISAAGAASGFTTITASGDITTSAGDVVIGTIGLNDTGAGVSGATLIGFDNTNTANLSSTTVQAAIDETFTDLASTATGDGAALVGIEDTGAFFTGTDVEAALQEIGAEIGSNAPNVDTMVFEPEYPNSALFGDGTSNNGKMELLYDSANREQHYRWTTKKNAAHDYDIRFRYTLPDDFVDAGDITLRFRTDTTVTGDNTIAVTVRNDTDNTTCHADAATAGAVAGTWETLTITGAEIDTGCTAGALLAAGDIIEVQIKMLADDSNSGGSDVGTLSFAYTN